MRDSQPDIAPAGLLTSRTPVPKEEAADAERLLNCRLDVEAQRATKQKRTNTNIRREDRRRDRARHRAHQAARGEPVDQSSDSSGGSEGDDDNDDDDDIDTFGTAVLDSVFFYGPAGVEDTSRPLPPPPTGPLLRGLFISLKLLMRPLLPQQNQAKGLPTATSAEDAPSGSGVGLHLEIPATWTCSPELVASHAADAR